MLSPTRRFPDATGSGPTIASRIISFAVTAVPTVGKDISAEMGKKFDFNASPSNQLFVMEFSLSWSPRDEKQAEREAGSEISMQKYLISQSNFL